jgi:hypothetical protein
MGLMDIGIMQAPSRRAGISVAQSSSRVAFELGGQ